MPARTALIGLLTCVTLAGCGGSIPPPPGATADAQLANLFDEYWQLYLREHPTRATYLGDHRYDDQLDDLSETARLYGINRRRRMLAQLDRVALADASPANRFNARIFRRTLETDIGFAELPEHLLPVRPQHGPHLALPMLRLSQPFETDAQCRKYAARLAAFPAQVDQAVARMRTGMQRGIVAPRHLMERCLQQLDAQITERPVESVLYLSYQAQRSPSASGEATNQAVLDAAAQAIAGYRRLRLFIQREYLPACTTTVGIGHLPGGRAWYVAAARLHTTTALTPDAIHQIGLDELRRIGAAMREIMSAEGFTGDVAAFCEALRRRPDQHFRTADEMMSEFAAVLRRSDARLPELFGRLPKTPYALKEIEMFRADAAPAAYYYQAPDVGSRPAYFYINTLRPQERPRFTMEALAYHEAMPGHHLQISLAQERRDLPDFRRHTSFTVFVEGWGLYSECLGKDLGGFQDRYQEFGRLTFDAWRACRLVVDTGLHAKGWTRQQAIDFMKRHTALSDIDIASEVDRYIAWPGQALAYKIGELEIRRMRREAEQRLGARFDVRKFHDVLLEEGAIPLDVLQERMRDWLASAADAAGSSHVSMR